MSESSYVDEFDTFYARRWRVRVDVSLVVLALTLLALGAMGWGYFHMLRPVTFQVDERPITILSNQTTVAGILHDASFPLMPEDVVFPALDAPVSGDQSISIRLARALDIQVDGARVSHRTQSKSLVDALGEAGIVLKTNDRLFLDGTAVQLSALIPAANGDTSPVHILVQRAVPLQVNDNGALTTVYTTAPTLGEALRQSGLIVYLGDYVTPDLGTPLSPGWQVYIRRSREASISVDNRVIRTRTRSDTIAELLVQEGVELKGKDYSIPAATESVREGLNVRVMRVREEFNTESEYIAHDTVWQADPTMEIDQRRVTQTGAEGVKKRTIRVLYENGREVKRSVDREWIESPPVAQIINYGSKIIKHDLTLPDGSTVQYWRKIRMLATSYTAATSGKARTHPEFGITATGMRAGTGIVATDPRVINLHTRLYVPGYGLATAGDTGGRIKGRRIDLGYDESNLVLWYKWIDVYLLDSPPPADQIHWVLPDTPKERYSH